jgi:prophage antirepressor-like protein
MSNLVLLKSAVFNSVNCDFYEDGNNFWMTREQIGTALEYQNPREAIKLIHKRHKDRLGMFSRGFQIETPRGGTQTTVIYSAKGIYEICRWSKQPKANEFYDFVYDILENLRTGKISNNKDVLANKVIDIKDRNARVRQANLLLKTADKYHHILAKESINLLISLATETAMGRPVLPRPAVNRTYTASEIGQELGISSHRVGKIANDLGLKTSEYGMFVLDKARYSNKQVQSFRYNDKGRAAIKAAVKVMA